MEFRVLALGDVTSEDGTRHLARTLRPFQKVHGVDFTVVNGENVSGVGLTPDQAEAVSYTHLTLPTTPYV